MRKFIDKSNLITYTSGKYKGKIDWENNIGKELYFEYEDISGYIKIIDYKKSKPQGYITLQYQDNIITTVTPNLIHLKTPSLFNKEKQSNKFKYDTGDIITKFNENIQVLEQLHITYDKSSARGYKLKCVKCGYEYVSREQCISTCPVCGRKASYSEKFVYQMLIRANVNFIPQKEFDWLHNKYYDIYLPNYNAIIEIHGKQHYEPTKLNRNETPEETYKNTKKNDRYKKKMALQNGISYYVIDTRESSKLFDNTVKELSFIDFSNVSEIECEKFINQEKIAKVCSLWNDGYDIEEIHNTLKFSNQKIQTYLRLGNKYGMCVYDKQLNMHNHKITNPNK